MDERLMAMIATPPGARLDAENISRALTAFVKAGEAAPVIARDEKITTNSLMITLGDVLVAVLAFPFRIPDEALASALGSELIWSEAGETFRTSAGHVLLAAIIPSDDPRQTFRQCRGLTVATAGVLTAVSGTGVFWRRADHVIEPNRFRQEAGDLRESEFAPSLWFSFRFFPGPVTKKGGQTLICQSTGLTVFLGRELECGPYRMAPAELAQTVVMVARFMATAGPVFGDGHTLSFGENSPTKDARLVYADSRQGGISRPVFRLQLAVQEQRSW